MSFVRLQVIDDGRKWVGKYQVDTGNRPDKHKRERPKSKRAVQSPVEAFPISRPVRDQTPAPARDSRPPDDRARDAQDREQNRAGAIHLAAGVPVQQIVVEIHEPEGEAYTGRIRGSKVRSRVRMEDTLLAFLVALEPELNDLIRVFGPPHVRDIPTGIGPLRHRFQLVIC